MNGGDPFRARECNVTDPIADIRKRSASSFGESGPRERMSPIGRQAKGSTDELVNECVTVALSRACCDLESELNQSRPKCRGAARVFRVQSTNGALSDKLLGCGALSGEIEDENLKLAQKLPDRFVIIGRSGIVQM
jgi:hypothetical protein